MFDYVAFLSFDLELSGYWSSEINKTSNARILLHVSSVGGISVELLSVSPDM